MTSIKHLALGCCILSAMAGMLRSFWPDNGFKAVINAVLMLYIVTAAVQLGGRTDWAGLARELRAWTSRTAAPADYSAYGENLTAQAVEGAVREVLEQGGIQATVAMQDGVCLVLLLKPSDRAAAETLLAQNCGTLPYRIQTGRETP